MSINKRRPGVGSELEFGTLRMKDDHDGSRKRVCFGMRVNEQKKGESLFVVQLRTRRARAV